jgi:hypothetical protein
MSKTFPQENFSPKKDVSFSSSLFLAFSGASQRWRWEFKNTTKNILQKKSCRKVLQKKTTKIPKPFFSTCFYCVFGAFLGGPARGEGSSKTPSKKHRTSGKNLTLALFWPLIRPPTTGVIAFLRAPLAVMTTRA